MGWGGEGDKEKERIAEGRIKRKEEMGREMGERRGEENEVTIG